MNVTFSCDHCISVLGLHDPVAHTSGNSSVAVASDLTDDVLLTSVASPVLAVVCAGSTSSRFSSSDIDISISLYRDSAITLMDLDD